MKWIANDLLVVCAVSISHSKNNRPFITQQIRVHFKNHQQKFADAKSDYILLKNEYIQRNDSIFYYYLIGVLLAINTHLFV